MNYIRAILSIDDIEKVIQILGLDVNYRFSFRDHCYRCVNRDESHIETLKIREYTKNEWNCKDILVIKKRTLIDGDVKKEVLVDQKECSNIEEAQKYINSKYPEFLLSFIFARKGVQCANGKLQIWIEDVEFLGISIEIGFDSDLEANEILSRLPVKSIVDKPLPDIIFDLVHRT